MLANSRRNSVLSTCVHCLYVWNCDESMFQNSDSLFRIIATLLEFISDRPRTSLSKLHVALPYRGRFQPLQRRSVTLLRRLVESFPGLADSLRALEVPNNLHDEGADLGVLSTLTHLEELSVANSGVTSIRGLCQCRALTRVDLCWCDYLTSLEGLEDLAHLEEILAEHTAIRTLGPLRSCHALRKVDVGGCDQLTSLEGLEDHVRLEEIEAYSTRITSLRPLRGCYALVEVNISGCDQLASLEGLEDHDYLVGVYMSETALTSLLPLRWCRALIKVDVSGCHELVSLEGMEDHEHLIERPTV